MKEPHVQHHITSHQAPRPDARLTLLRSCKGVGERERDSCVRGQQLPERAQRKSTLVRGRRNRERSTHTRPSSHASPPPTSALNKLSSSSSSASSSSLSLFLTLSLSLPPSLPRARALSLSGLQVHMLPHNRQSERTCADSRCMKASLSCVAQQVPQGCKEGQASTSVAGACIV